MIAYCSSSLCVTQALIQAYLRMRKLYYTSTNRPPPLSYQMDLITTWNSQVFQQKRFLDNRCSDSMASSQTGNFIKQCGICVSSDGSEDKEIRMFQDRTLGSWSSQMWGNWYFWQPVSAMQKKCTYYRRRMFLYALFRFLNNSLIQKMLKSYALDTNTHTCQASTVSYERTNNPLRFKHPTVIISTQTPVEQNLWFHSFANNSSLGNSRTFLCWGWRVFFVLNWKQLRNVYAVDMQGSSTIIAGINHGPGCFFVLQ